MMLETEPSSPSWMHCWSMQPLWHRNGPGMGMPPTGVFVPAACKRSGSHGESWDSLKAEAALGSWRKPRDICRKSPIHKTKDVLTCVTVLLPSLLPFLAVSVEVTHGAIHACGDSLAPQLGTGLSPVQQPWSLSTQRPGIRWGSTQTCGKMPSKWWETANDSVDYLTQQFPAECRLPCGDTMYGNSFPSAQGKHGVHGTKKPRTFL